MHLLIESYSQTFTFPSQTPRLISSPLNPPKCCVLAHVPPPRSPTAVDSLTFSPSTLPWLPPALAQALNGVVPTMLLAIASRGLCIPFDVPETCRSIMQVGEQAGCSHAIEDAVCRW